MTRHWCHAKFVLKQRGAPESIYIKNENKTTWMTNTDKTKHNRPQLYKFTKNTGLVLQLTADTTIQCELPARLCGDRRNGEWVWMGDELSDCDWFARNIEFSAVHRTGHRRDQIILLDQVDYGETVWDRRKPYCCVTPQPVCDPLRKHRLTSLIWVQLATAMTACIHLTAVGI